MTFPLTDHDTFLAYSKVSGIDTTHMFPHPNPPRPPIENATSMHNVIGLAADLKSQRYFFSDIQRGDIQTVGFDGTGFKVVISSKYS